MIDKEIVVILKHGQELYSSRKLDSRDRPAKVRVSGKCKTWKTRPGDFKLPVKYGMYESFYIENGAFAEHLFTDKGEALAKYQADKERQRQERQEP